MVDPDDLHPDQLEGTPHPREQPNLFGHAAAEQAFLAAWRSGNLHHAWLLGGLEGIGKATFAYRAARFLLANPDAAAAADRSDLAVLMGHPVARKVAALSHPDLALVRRGPRRDGRGWSLEISVDATRRALETFHVTAGSGGWRVCIVDAADDLNQSSANALLKMLEEPPPRSVFFVVAHRPARLLPTIRSRCRMLPLRPLDADDVVRAVRGLGEEFATCDAAVLERASALSGGSVRRAISLLDADTLALVEKVETILERLPDPPMESLIALAESVSGRGRERDFETALSTVLDWIARRVRSGAGEGARRLAPLVEVWEKSARAAREAEELNLDRRPLVISMFGDLADAVRRSRAAWTAAGRNS